MQHGNPDTSEEVPLRALERRYAQYAARFFRAHKIPLPARLPKSTGRETEIDILPRQTRPAPNVRQP
jgi:hypothetical protein